VKSGKNDVRSTGNEPRQALRDRLIAAREAMPAHQVLAAGVTIEKSLEQLLSRLSPAVVGFCWPYRGEFDCRPLVARWLRGAAGRRAALPVIVAPATPMPFRQWSPDSPMRAGRFGIPVPASGADILPDLLLMPVNAFDDQGYRLGYGGGYFDRTLAALAPRPVAVGIGFELARVASIDPGPFDIPMDYVVSEAGVFSRCDGAPYTGSQPRNSS
jgi:5,10-methenyltetrahydrofolate synthetase